MEEISYAGSKGTGKKRLSKRLIVFGGLFLVVLLLLGSAIYFITQDNETPESESNEATNTISLPDKEEISEMPTPTEEITVTPEKSITSSKLPSKTPTGVSSASDLKIVVQNGSGVTGAAGDAADVLKAAGFTIASTGNADSSDYTGVTIKIKNSEKSNLSNIEDALAKDYTVEETASDLPETTSYDVLVIIGK